jgi:hypothetical protein
MSLPVTKRFVRGFSRIRMAAIAGVLLAVPCTLAMTASPASASVGQNPANCGNPVAVKYTDFKVASDTIRVELRHSYPCQAGWGRIEALTYSTVLNITFSAWNPGQPSQGQIAGTDYTSEVNAAGGDQFCAGFQAWSVNGVGKTHYVGWFDAGCWTTPTFTETVGGPTHTWTNYSNAGGSTGTIIPTHQSVQVSCVTQGFKVADGNTNWYLIASSPWSNAYYASADAFYNNGATSGSLDGTPYVDPQVPAC